MARQELIAKAIPQNVFADMQNYLKDSKAVNKVVFIFNHHLAPFFIAIIGLFS